MRIGIDARPLQYDNFAGISTYLFEILKCLSNDKENEYILYCHKPLNSVAQFSGNIETRLIKGKIGSLWLRYILPNRIRKDHIDVFWGPNQILPKKVPGVKYVVTVHDIALLVNPSWGTKYNSFINRLFVPCSVKDADAVITVSDYTKSDLIRILKTDGRKIHRAYPSFNGCNNDNQHTPSGDAMKKYGLSNNYFLYLGTLEPRKNVETIIKAFEHFCENYHDDYFIVLAGGLGWKYESTLNLIENSRFKNKIIRTGYISFEDKQELYKNTFAFIYPSHYEGFGIPILEAMKLGSIVITARNSSLPEVAGPNGLYIDDENDYIGLSGLMEKTTRFSLDEKNQIVQENQKYVEHFSWEKCSDEIKKILTNI